MRKHGNSWCSTALGSALLVDAKKNIWVTLGPWSPLSYVLNTHVFKMQHIKHAKSTRGKIDKQTTNQPTSSFCLSHCVSAFVCYLFLVVAFCSQKVNIEEHARTNK